MFNNRNKIDDCETEEDYIEEDDDTTQSSQTLISDNLNDSVSKKNNNP